MLSLQARFLIADAFVEVVAAGVFTIVLLPLLFLFLKRRYFPERVEERQGGENAGIIPSVPVRPRSAPLDEVQLDGEWLGQYGDVWKLHGKITIENGTAEGRMRWTLESCPSYPSFMKKWAKRVGDTAYESVKGDYNEEGLSIKGYKASDEEFVQLHKYDIAIDWDNRSFEGDSCALKHVVKQEHYQGRCC